MEDEPSVEYLTRFVAETKQKFTQKGGARPFGVSLLLCGSQNKQPKLFKTEPSGAFSEWKAHAIGRSSDTLREYMLKEYKEGMSQDATVKLAVQTLMETVETIKNIDVCVMTVD